MRNVMKKAHEITRKIIRKGDSYRATFRMCLSFVHSKLKEGANKMVELVGSEKQVKWANDLREGFSTYIEFCKELIEEIGITEDIEEELEYAGFRNIKEAFEVINTQNSSKKIIEALKGNDYIKLAEKDRIMLECAIGRLTKKAIIEEKECIICNTIITLGDMK